MREVIDMPLPEFFQTKHYIWSPLSPVWKKIASEGKFFYWFIIMGLSDYRACMFINRRKFAPPTKWEVLRTIMSKYFFGGMYDYSLTRNFWRCQHGILRIFINIALKSGRNKIIWITILVNRWNIWLYAQAWAYTGWWFLPWYILRIVNVTIQKMLFPLLDN